MPDRAERTRTLGDSVAEGALKASQPPQSELAAHFNADLLEYLIANSLGSDPAVLALHRYLPVEIYLEGEPANLEPSPRAFTVPRYPQQPRDMLEQQGGQEL